MLLAKIQGVVGTGSPITTFGDNGKEVNVTK